MSFFMIFMSDLQIAARTKFPWLANAQRQNREKLALFCFKITIVAPFCLQKNTKTRHCETENPEYQIEHDAPASNRRLAPPPPLPLHFEIASSAIANARNSSEDIDIRDQDVDDVKRCKILIMGSTECY